MVNETLTITKEKISSPSVGTVMHEWEHPIMKAKADFVCQKGGDIIEFGFGLGISATYIQKHNINSHTICEINPQILNKLHIWAKNKSNVTILEGDWFDNINKMGKYDGILFDTHMDNHAFYFPKLLPDICKPKCLVTWWNNSPTEYNEFKIKNTKFTILDVNPPKNTYFNHKHYYMPKYIYNHGYMARS